MLKNEIFENKNEFQGTNFKKHSEELSFLSSLGFATNPFNKKVKSLEQVWEYANEINQKRDSLNYPIDGLVVKIDDNILASKLGVVGKTPRAWCAIKFPAIEVTTTLNAITWQVGRTGKVTPVAELQPVSLAQTIVKRATLHNYKEMKSLNLYKNDTLVIRKAGDIIPEVLQVIDNLRESKIKFQPPKNCPICCSTLVETDTGIDIFCKNSDGCSAQVIGRLSYYTKRNLANIVGLSDKIIERFIKEYNIKDVPDLYNLPFDKISLLEGFGSKSVQNLKDSIESSRSISANKFLAALGIDSVGPEVANIIVKKLQEKIHDDPKK
jgi:DNA ligase (NAD+)